MGRGHIGLCRDVYIYICKEYIGQYREYIGITYGVHANYTRVCRKDM